MPLAERTSLNLYNYTWNEMMADVMTICDFGLMKLGRLAEREAWRPNGIHF